MLNKNDFKTYVPIPRSPPAAKEMIPLLIKNPTNAVKKAAIESLIKAITSAMKRIACPKISIKNEIASNTILITNSTTKASQCLDQVQNQNQTQGS